MMDAREPRKSSDPIDESVTDESRATPADESSEQTAGAGANNPARASETGGNSIEVGDDIQHLMEIDPN
jgi:hypothetical protein